MERKGRNPATGDSMMLRPRRVVTFHCSGNLRKKINQGQGLREETKMPTDCGKVVVTDIKIPFRSMVILMVKWAVATIPALVILILFGSITFGVISALWVAGI